jgi:hypothetical protein
LHPQAIDFTAMLSQKLMNNINNSNQNIQSQPLVEMNHSYYVNNNNDQIEEEVELEEENSKDLIVQGGINPIEKQEVDENQNFTKNEASNITHESHENIAHDQDESEQLNHSDNLNQPVSNELI